MFTDRYYELREKVSRLDRNRIQNTLSITQSQFRVIVANQTANLKQSPHRDVKSSKICD